MLLKKQHTKQKDNYKITLKKNQELFSLFSAFLSSETLVYGNKGSIIKIQNPWRKFILMAPLVQSLGVFSSTYFSFFTYFSVFKKTCLSDIYPLLNMGKHLVHTEKVYSLQFLGLHFQWFPWTFTYICCKAFFINYIMLAIQGKSISITSSTESRPLNYHFTPSALMKFTCFHVI